MAFSTAPLIQTTPLIINFVPQYIYNGILYNNNWQLLTYNFTADSAYQYITFGSFVNDTMQQMQLFDPPTNYSGASYFIDDINLEVSTGLNAYSNSKSAITVFPGIFSDRLNIACNNDLLYEISLYDASSKKVVQQLFDNSYTVNTVQLKKGVYLFEVKNKNIVFKSGKVVKQ